MIRSFEWMYFFHNDAAHGAPPAVASLSHAAANPALGKPTLDSRRLAEAAGSIPSVDRHRAVTGFC
jgi:hypothetical protein